MSKYMFGQIVIGPPGSGKTTYCYEMKKLLKELDRKVIVVNIGKNISENVLLINVSQKINYNDYFRSSE